MAQQYTPPSSSVTAAGTVPNNMVMAIIATVVSVIGCCLPHGLVSLMFAMQVGKKEAAGDLEGAKNSAKQAKMWAWISIIVGALTMILGFIFGVFAGIISALNR